MGQIAHNYALIITENRGLLVSHCQVFTDASLIEFATEDEAMQYAAINGIDLGAEECHEQAGFAVN